MRKISFVFPLIAMFACLAQLNAQDSFINPPNVVFIYADDIGIGDFSCYGATEFQTPNVDRAAEEGIKFTNVHSAASVCTPSRYAMLMGEYAWRRRGTDVTGGDAAMIIQPDRYTLADLFKQVGYETGIVGKWGLGLGDKAGAQNWNEQFSPGLRDLGFDYSFIMATDGAHVPCVFLENDAVVNTEHNDSIEVNYNRNFHDKPSGRTNPELLNVKPSFGHDQGIVNGISRIGYMQGGEKALWNDREISKVLTEKAISYIESQHTKPFFLYFATHDAHVPRVPGNEFAGKSGMGPRGDSILEFDWSVGQIMNRLRELGLENNTLIVISSDNGPVINDGYNDMAMEMLGEHTPGGVYRGGKYSSFEAGTRVPCIWRWPLAVSPGESDALLCQMDWFATFAQMLGATLPEGAAPDSESLLSAWKGETSKGREWLVLQNQQNNLAITNGEWKYIPPAEGPFLNKNSNIEIGNRNEPQLYNLKEDARERKNLAKQEAQLTIEIDKELRRIVDNRYGLPL